MAELTRSRLTVTSTVAPASSTSPYTAALAGCRCSTMSLSMPAEKSTEGGQLQVPGVSGSGDADHTPQHFRWPSHSQAGGQGAGGGDGVASADEAPSASAQLRSIPSVRRCEPAPPAT